MFVDSQLVAEIDFRGWTDEPSCVTPYKGLREGADHSEIMDLGAEQPDG